MTGSDADAEPLRVPPWLAGQALSPSGPRPPDPEVPVPAPVPAPAPEAAPAADDAAAPWPPAPDRDGWHAADEPSELRGLLVTWRSRLIVASVAAALSLLVILLVAAFLGPDSRTAPPAATDLPPPGPAVPSPSAPPSPLSSPPPSPSASSSAPRPSPPRSSPPVTFGPVTFEAEAPGNALGGSAWVDRYPGASGGSIVRNLGDWGGRDGFLRFQGVTVPAAGTYTLRLYHVNIDNERTRTAVITVAGSDPQRVTLTGGATCCTAATLKVVLRKGGNSITVSNPDGHAPSVDRIVLSLP
ncbi:hypothetical protein [Dactylosporangium sp. NPDC005555]|uniref:hypothetical protein n=1 Tax=Dactylosporangium sp. NPDC005555 TaxID=3154889 RepID=UPI0033AE8DA6